MTDTASFTHDDMVRKVAALLETAESFAEQGNDEAAQSYVEKAHALQQKYSIDQAMIAERTGQKVEKIISKRITMHGKWGLRKVTLAHVIAHRTHCTGYYTRGYAKKMGPGLVEVIDYDTRVYFYNVFGFESDVDHVEYLINSLNNQLDSALSHAMKNKPAWEHGKSYNASFCMGFTSTIGSRLLAASRQAEKEAAGGSLTGAQSVALVLVTKKAQVEAEMKAQVGSLRKGNDSHATSGSGYGAGREAGSRATIARGSVGGSSKGSLGR